MQIETTSVSKRTNRRKLTVLLGVLFAALASPLFVNIFLQAHRSNQAFAAFSSALVSKDYQRAYTLTASEFRSAMTEEEFASQQATLSSSLGELREVKRNSFDTHDQGDGWSSEITARFIFVKGDRVFDFEMKREGTRWTVFGYRER